MSARNPDRPDRAEVSRRPARPFSWPAAIGLVLVLVVVGFLFSALHVGSLAIHLTQFLIALATAAYWRGTNRDGWLLLVAVTLVAGLNSLPIGQWTLLLDVLAVIGTYVYGRHRRSAAISPQGPGNTQPIDPGVHGPNA